MTARYEMTKAGLEENKCEMKFWHSLITLLLRLHFLGGDQYLRERRRYVLQY
jgi:hypothetical protein